MKFKSLAILFFALAFGQGVFGQAAYRYDVPGYTFPTSHVDYSTNNLSMAAFSIPTSDYGMLFGTNANPSGQSNEECLLTKTDLNGNVQWAVTLLDPNNPTEQLSPQHAVEAPGDGYYIIGYYKQSSSGLSSGFVSFVNLSGNIQWSRRLNLAGAPNAYQTLRKGILADNGDLIAAGIQHNPGVTKGCITAFDASGNQSFSEVSVSSSGASMHYVDIEPAEPGECIALAGGGQKVFLVHRTNDCQTMDWYVSANLPVTNGYTYPEAVAYHPATGGYFISGSLHFPGQIKGFLAYADKQGNFQWVRQLTGPNLHTVGKDLVCEGEYAYVTGSSYGSSNTGLKYGYLAKFDDQANLYWCNRFTPSGLPNERLFLNSIEIWYDPQVPGSAKFFQIGGLSKEQGSGAFDHIAAHLTYIDTYDDECSAEPMQLWVGLHPWSQASWPVSVSPTNDLNTLGLHPQTIENFLFEHCGSLKTRPIDAPEAPTEDWKVFPNPIAVGSATNALQIRIPQTELPAYVTLTDLQGRVVRAFTQSEVQSEADVRSLPAGMYILNASGKANHYSKRITIEK